MNSYFNEYSNFKSKKSQLIEFKPRYGYNIKIGIITYYDPIDKEYHVTTILPASENGREEIINKEDIINYITKAGWSKIDKYISQYEKAKDKWHFTRDRDLTQNEIDIVASENDADAYKYQYRKKIRADHKTVRKVCKKVTKKCKCKK